MLYNDTQSVGLHVTYNGNLDAVKEEEEAQ